MSDLESVLSTAVTPNPTSISELRRGYIARAKRNSSLAATTASASCTASSKTLGTEWGVGVGLYFEVLKWLRYLALLLMLCAVPFLVVVGCSIFTDAAHMHDHSFGVKKYTITQVHSLTFAAIVDDTLDNGTLPYMNILLAKTWKGPMRKSSFLIWISLVDAASTLLFLLGMAALWYHLKRFARATDEDTLEAADYTIVVRGLPADVDAVQVGEHFSRYGEVMDVVLVTDRLGATLKHCRRAARLQQRQAMVLDAFKVRQSATYTAMVDKFDKQLTDIAEEVRELAESKQKVKAAFITFNSENERKTCTSYCPSGWLASLFQRRKDRFLLQHRFWVHQAAAPDDYQFEDLAVSEWQLFAREVAINVVMLLLVLLCASAIAKLTDISNQESYTVNFYKDRLVADSAAAMVLYTNTNSSITSTHAGTEANASALLGSELYSQLEGFCSRQLQDSCMMRLQSEYFGLVRMDYGAGLTWVNATSRLLFERALQEELECSTAASMQNDMCQLQGCLSCICLGIALGGPVTSEMGLGSSRNPSNSDVESTCSPYINQLDVRSWGIRLSISAVVAVLNSFIKWLLSVLVVQGRHWTHTARERSYALQCFVAMLFNTVVVLLVTNCEPLAKLARESQNNNWTRFFVKYGSYDDFTPGWYENVGLSILILMIINISGPLLNLLLEEALLISRRCCVLYSIAWPLQSDYDVAWSRPRFTLAQRIADLLLNVSLALLFGSGMPLLYLVLALYVIAAELADRWALTRLCRGAPRYNTGLMKVVMALLPWMAVAHCAFGLWMHTYFRVVVPGNSNGIEEVSHLTEAVNNAALKSSSSNLSVLQRSSVWHRITQPNGLSLLCVMAGLVLWLVIGR
ncbi:hypothetical protein VaNZ11_004035 [Volvox africanus]|uniref:RRM domain-containing protein n=1 Tax=Volvox africanus TaxID=51714 RepID=A0ABQ5RVL3_9CHLO|nr:hypothetical protein VaNZ11_004035 [Volvox africanus]